MPTTEFAPAKINLALHVTGQRDDGYHDLDMLVAFADIGDRITVTPSGTDRLTMTGPFADDLAAIEPNDNLVMKALTAFRATHDVPALSIMLEKLLPPASGIGGGSADAAAMLRALTQMTGQTLPDAALLGADVPMCVVGQPLRAQGTGDRLSLIGHLPDLPVVLVNPRVPVSTPAVFRALTERDNTPLPDPGDMPDTVSDLAAWLAAHTRNDLTGASIDICPTIESCLAELESQGVLLARMSGSGATCFGIFSTYENAQLASAAITRNHPHWWCCATRLRGTQGSPRA